MPTRTIPCLLAALAAFATAIPQDPIAPKKNRPPFVFEAGTLELRELIDSCAAYLQWNILVDDQELGGNGKSLTVTLQQPVATDHQGCEELLGGLLWTRGLALVPIDEDKKVYEVLSMHGQRRSEVMSRAVQRTPEQVQSRPNLRQWITTVHPLAHTNAQIATNALRPFFAQVGMPQNGGGLTFGNVGNDTAILINGPQHMVAAAIDVLRTADVPSTEREPALAARVAELGKQLESLTARLGSVEDKLAKAPR